MEQNQQGIAPEVENTAELETEGQANETVEQGQPEQIEQQEAPQEGQADEQLTQEEIDYRAEYDRINNSYSELRSKFDRGNQEYKQQLSEMEEDLNLYQSYYEENNQLLEALNNNPELLEQLKAGIQPEQLSKDDVDSLVEQKIQAKLEEERLNAEFDMKIDKWNEENKDVPDAVMEKVLADVENANIEGLNNDQIIGLMDRALAYHTLDHQKAIGAKEEQARQQSIKKASIGGATNQTEQTQAPKDDFFAPKRFNNDLF